MRKLTHLPFYIFLFLLTSVVKAEKPIFSTQFIKKGDDLIYLKLPQGNVIESKALRSMSSQIQGLSGVKRSELQKHQGALFIYEKMGPRYFWMPDTYFDLCIIFMNPELKILELIKNAPHHPGRQEPPVIFRSKQVIASHVLEIKTSSGFCQNLKKDQTLRVIKGDHRQKK